MCCNYVNYLSTVIQNNLGTDIENQCCFLDFMEDQDYSYKDYKDFLKIDFVLYSFKLLRYSLRIIRKLC